ncbi:unnamed protein product [Symbiodinium natans]|uniref:Uncharacterized protein n=1 Tax=Symbiodinium natans TaxID=878477 RepID=A0A812SYP6_9DINO|nr:unnamed protein product [Symbiodinium natans]
MRTANLCRESQELASSCCSGGQCCLHQGSVWRLMRETGPAQSASRQAMRQVGPMGMLRGIPFEVASVVVDHSGQLGNAAFCRSATKKYLKGKVSLETMVPAKRNPPYRTSKQSRP